MIDAAREGYFFNNDPNYKPEAATLESFPELYAIVSRDYEQIAGNERCAAIYLRRDKVAALRAAEIPLQSSPPVLVTSSGTEKCGDWWAPEPPNATAELTVEPAQPVAELWVLASGGGVGDYLVRRRSRNDPSADPIHFGEWRPERESRAVARLPRLDGRRPAR